MKINNSFNIDNFNKIVSKIKITQELVDNSFLLQILLKTEEITLKEINDYNDTMLNDIDTQNSIQLLYHIDKANYLVNYCCNLRFMVNLYNKNINEYIEVLFQYISYLYKYVEEDEEYVNGIEIDLKKVDVEVLKEEIKDDWLETKDSMYNDGSLIYKSKEDYINQFAEDEENLNQYLEYCDTFSIPECKYINSLNKEERRKLFKEALADVE